MVGIIFAILCAVFIGFSQVFLRKSYKNLSPSVAFLFDSFFGLFLWVPLALFLGVSEGVNLWEALFFAFVSAILSEAIVFYALSHGELAVTATVLTTYPAYTVVFSRIFNRELLPWEVYVFIIIAIVGSIFASLPEKISKKEINKNRGIVWPFLAAICIGLSDTISKGYINRSSDFSFLLMLGFIQIPVALVYLRLENESLTNSIRGVVGKYKEYGFALLGGLFNIIGTGFLWLSFFSIPASIASPITGSNGALTVLFSRIFLNERVSLRKYIGIVLALTGVFGLALFK